MDISKGLPTMKIYTRKGDDGTTGLLFGGRVSKADMRPDAYGTVDTAISAMGMARALSASGRVQDILLKCQHEMFTVATEVATDPEHYDRLIEHFSPVTETMVERLEGWIDEIKAEVELPPQFIVPGASPASGAIDLARTLTRDAERRIVALDQHEPLRNANVLSYVNRLSDLLFILARLEDKDLPFEVTTGKMRKEKE
jgi:cob(I)alamin adenosyltransferase